MATGDRVPGDIEKATAVRDGLIDILQESPAVKVVAPSVLDSGHPGFMVATDEGVFIVSVNKVSSALVESVGGGQ